MRWPASASRASPCVAKAAYTGAVRLLVAVALAGCRIGFDPRVAGDGGVGDDVGDAGDAAQAAIDAGPIALTCNTPVALSTGTAANPHLTAAAGGNGFVAIWLDDTGHPVSQTGLLTTPTMVQATAAVVDPSGPWSMVSAAISGTTLLVALGTTDLTATGGSLVHPYDTTTGQSAGAPMMSGVRVASTRGLTAVTGAFSLDGLGFNPIAGAYVERLSPTGAVTMQATRAQDAATTARIATLADGATTAVAGAGPNTPCAVRLQSSGALGPAAFWGATGMCVQPIAIPAAVGRSILLVRKDTSDGNLNHQIATVPSGSTISLPGEGKLANVADEPRGIAIGTGFWVGYHAPTNTLEVVTVDSGSVVGTPISLGPTASLDAHDLLVIAGEPYAVWFANGLQIAHLCP